MYMTSYHTLVQSTIIISKRVNVILIEDIFVWSFSERKYRLESYLEHNVEICKYDTEM